MKHLIKSILIGLMIGILTFSCADLTLEDEIPEIELDLETIQNMAENSMRTYFNINQEYSSLAMNMATMADQLTMAWGKTRDLSTEPRDYLLDSYLNSASYAYYNQLNDQWKYTYKAISYANKVLEWTDSEDASGVDALEIARLKAFSYFVSGISHGSLGMIFDKACIVTPDNQLSIQELLPYKEVVDEAITILEKSIAICENENFEIPLEWVAGQSMTNIELAELANAFAAKLLMSQSRNKADNETNDWERILSYAQKGMDWDFSPTIGETYEWYDFYWVYGRYPGWARTDMRIVNLMDHNYPSHWPADNESWNTPDGNDPEEAGPGDARIVSDFEYLASNNFPPDRGYYYYSHYRFSRYDYLNETAWYGEGIKPYFMAWEVQLIEAEAQFRTENTGEALAILNSPDGARKSRGHLPDVLASEDVLRYIYDEKDIECMLTMAGTSYFDMRRTDRLQPGTLLQFPVPETELKLMMQDVYTFKITADGINGSAGGWTGWDE